MKRFVHEYLNKEYLEMVKRVFPNMSGDVNKEQSGPLQKWPVQKKRRITWCRGRRHGGICDHRGRNLDLPQAKDEEGGSNQAGTQDYHPYPRMSAEESSQ